MRVPALLAYLRRFRDMTATEAELWVGLVLTGLAILIMSGCAERPGPAMRVRLSPSDAPLIPSHPSPTTTPSQVVYFAGGPSPPAAVIQVRGVLVYPPAWFPSGDEDALARAIGEYLDDAEAELGWRLPRLRFGRPLVLVLHDDQARGFVEYSSSYRVAILQWPAGPSGLPLAVGIVPELEAVLALEHQIDAGRGARGPSAEETELGVRGRTLPVAIATRYPWLYQR